MASGYKCTTAGCYSYQSPETDALFKRLQTLINQFAAAAAIAPIKVDGVLGKGTTEAVLYVLQVLGESDKGVVGSSALSIADAINGPEQLAQYAQTVVDTLTLATKTTTVAVSPPAPIPVAVPTPGAAVVATSVSNLPIAVTDPVAAAKIQAIVARKPGLKRSLLERIPPWAPYAGGGLLAIAAVAVAVAAAKKRKGGLRPLSPAVAGRW
jgi:hypothetical protein